MILTGNGNYDMASCSLDLVLNKQTPAMGYLAPFPPSFLPALPQPG